MTMWTWLIGAFGGGKHRCNHDWRFVTWQQADQYRTCNRCARLELFEPDVGGWTSGHWNEVR